MFAAVLCGTLFTLPPQNPERLSRDYVDAVATINEAQAKKPLAPEERELGAKLPVSAVKSLDKLIAMDDANSVREALVAAGHAALALDRIDDFERVRIRLAALDDTRAAELGIAISRPRFLALGQDGVQPAGLAAVADAFDLVLDGYAEVFGLTAFSKVPGKKLRLKVHLVEAITRPPHFAPEFPFHSEIDFPVIDPDGFASPTKQGQFLFYGMCHELGHVIAMWGDQQNEEDHHAWAHYTGVVLVEHLAKTKKNAPTMKHVKDERWRSLTFEAKQLEAKHVAPGGKDTDAVLARLVSLHEAVGPRVIGETINTLDVKDKHLLVNRVRYYSMHDFEQALLATKAGRSAKNKIEEAFAN